jgi:hypothetical protein
MAGMIRLVTTRIAFDRPPAQAGIGDGIRLAARYWASSAERWVLPVTAIALASGLVSWLFTGSLTDRETLDTLVRMSIAGTPVDPATVPRLVAGPLAIAIVSLVAGWFLAANAIVGLRGRDLTVGWVVTGGLRSFLANLLVGLVVVATLLPLLALGALGLLIILAGLPVAAYLVLRLSFWTLALFDGESVGTGLGVTWRITRGAVLRCLGWSLALLPLGITVTVGQLIVDGLLGPVAKPFADAITAAADATVSSYTILVLAVLYESQRGRVMPSSGIAAPPRSPFDPPAPPPGPPWG